MTDYCGMHDVRYEDECFRCARRIPEPERDEWRKRAEELQEELNLIRGEYAKSDKHVRDAHQEMAEMERELDKARAEAARLREALEFYATQVQCAGQLDEFYAEGPLGWRAREALAPRETGGDDGSG